MHLIHTIKERIFLGFFAVLVLFAATFLVGYVLTTDGKAIATVTSERSQQMKHINAILNLTHSLENEVDSFFLAPYAQHLTGSQERLRDIADTLRAAKGRYVSGEDVRLIEEMERIVGTLGRDVLRIFPLLMREADEKVSKSVVLNEDIVALYGSLAALKQSGETLLQLTIDDIRDGAARQKEIFSRLVSVSLFLWLMAVMLGLVIALRMSGAIATSVKQLNSFSQEVAKGNLDISVTIRTGDEIEDLATSFSQMARQLRAQKEELASYNRTLEEKIKERTGALESTNTELKTMNALMIGREVAMAKLKERIAELEKKAAATS